MGYYVKPIVCDYGVYDDRDQSLCLLCNRKGNAELILRILQADNGDDAEHNHDKVCRDYKSLLLDRLHALEPIAWDGEAVLLDRIIEIVEESL